MQQGRASSRRTTRLACKPTRVTCRLRLYSDGRRSRAGRRPDPGESELWSRRGFCDFPDAFCESSTQSIFWSTTDLRCGTRLSRLPGCNRGAEDIFAAHNVKSLADVADERDEGLPVRGAVEAI